MSLDVRKKEGPINAVVRGADNFGEEVEVFKLRQVGDQPELIESPLKDPSLGQRIGGEEESNIPKQPCPIQISLEVRKKEGSTLTAVVRNAGNNADEVHVF